MPEEHEALTEREPADERLYRLSVIPTSKPGRQAFERFTEDLNLLFSPSPSPVIAQNSHRAPW
jgi:hypothetical protein